MLDAICNGKLKIQIQSGGLGVVKLLRSVQLRLECVNGTKDVVAFGAGDPAGSILPMFRLCREDGMQIKIASIQCQFCQF